MVNPESQIEVGSSPRFPVCPIARSLSIIIQTIIQNHDDFRAPPESDETTGLRPNFHSGRDGALLPRAVVSPRRFLDRRLPLSVSADLATTTSRNRPSSRRLPPRWRRLAPPGRTASPGRWSSPTSPRRAGNRMSSRSPPTTSSTTRSSSLSSRISKLNPTRSSTKRWAAAPTTPPLCPSPTLSPPRSSRAAAPGRGRRLVPSTLTRSTQWGGGGRGSAGVAGRSSSPSPRASCGRLLSPRRVRGGPPSSRFHRGRGAHRANPAVGTQCHGGQRHNGHGGRRHPVPARPGDAGRSPA